MHVINIVNSSGFIPRNTPTAYDQLQYNQKEKVDHHTAKNPAFSEPSARIITNIVGLT